MIYLQDPDVTLHQGDVLDTLQQLPDGSVDCVVTSPPYWGLRDYGDEGQLGLEPTPDEYVARMVGVFREVRRVLADHGTCWVNLGDSYNGSSGNGGLTEKQVTNVGSYHSAGTRLAPSLKPKDLVGIPWRVAFALQADGWYLRSDIVWAKPNPMPESVTDRPTKAHEYVFLLSKRSRYFFDQEAVREPLNPDSIAHHDRYGGRHTNGKGVYAERMDADRPMNGGVGYNPSGRNIRSVWDIATQPYSEAHFATFPEELVRRCLLAGCPERVCRVCGKPRERIVERESYITRPTTGRDTQKQKVDPTTSKGLGRVGGHVAVDTQTLGFTDCGHNDYRTGVVLDIFGGSGTTALVARKHARHVVLIELNPDYCQMAARRLSQQSLFAEAL